MKRHESLSVNQVTLTQTDGEADLLLVNIAKVCVFETLEFAPVVHEDDIELSAKEIVIELESLLLFVNGFDFFGEV